MKMLYFHQFSTDSLLTYSPVQIFLRSLCDRFGHNTITFRHAVVVVEVVVFWGVVIDLSTIT